MGHVKNNHNNPSGACNKVYLGCITKKIFLGGVEMVIGWICSCGVFETSWEGLQKVLPIVIAEESRMFSWVLSLSQWCCYHNFEPLVYCIRMYTPDAGDHGEPFWSGFG